MTKRSLTAHVGPRPVGRIMIALRWAARRLELRAFGLVPEHFDPQEGYRAAAAVGGPLILALVTGRHELGWAVFAAFWTCLCDAPSPDRLRRRVLGFFVVFGAIATFIGSTTAAFAADAGHFLGPVLVFFAVVAGGYVRNSGLLGTLLAVVAVVAVGFPLPLPQALMQAGAFLLGSSWAYLLINVLWRSDQLAPLKRMTDAVALRLLDMAESLVVLAEKPHRDAEWHSEHAEHRRTVRLSIERLRVLLDRYDSIPNEIAPFVRARDAAEMMFNALIALDQAFIEQIEPTAERMAVARACRTTLLAWRLQLRMKKPDNISLTWADRRLEALAPKLSVDLFLGCVRALREALALLSAPIDQPAIARTDRWWRRAPMVVVRQALRQSAGLVGVYFAAIVFHLGYPYWAAMAVVVVLQGDARVTWTRCLERILGTVLGGMLALALLLAVTATLPLAILAIALAAGSIALRTVNYTVFVVLLTMLFVIVTEILQPGAGIASARMVDNIIGSLAALIAVFLLWPDFGASLRNRIAESIAAHRAYFEAVLEDRPLAEIEIARRRAGLASIEAEVALHDFGGLPHRLHLPVGADALLRLRTIAGKAAILWHRRLGTN